MYNTKYRCAQISTNTWAAHRLILVSWRPRRSGFSPPMEQCHGSQLQLASSTGLKINQNAHHGPMARNQPPAQKRCSWHRSQRGVDYGDHQNKRRLCTYATVAFPSIGPRRNFVEHSTCIPSSQPDQDSHTVARCTAPSSPAALAFTKIPCTWYNSLRLRLTTKRWSVSFGESHPTDHDATATAAAGVPAHVP